MNTTLEFFHQFARHHREVGALAPSGAHLARAMVKALGPQEKGRVLLELGPGTGAITRQLLHTHPRCPIFAIETSPVFARQLRKKLPQIRVWEDCASRLPEILDVAGLKPGQIGGIISGIPMLSLTAGLRQAILAAIVEVLQPGRRFVQFTYWKPAWNTLAMQGLQLNTSQMIWMNIPPAVVLPFERVLESDGQGVTDADAEKEPLILHPGAWGHRIRMVSRHYYRRTRRMFRSHK
jgi:phosphatidylethanolamine/phosphatidyl-N-methylethanolamine N-methyltransferase